MSALWKSLRRIWSALRPAKNAQLAPTAIRKAGIKPGARETAILHAIRVLHDNAYGVTIQEELERRKMEISFGTIYNCLEWLEDNGFVRSRQGEATFERGGRRKKMFTLTSKGEEALRG